MTDFDLVSAALDAELDKMEKSLDLRPSSIDKDEPRISTGLLSLDLVLAGGLVGGGWYTFFGGEQSCKTTGAYTILASVVNNSFKNLAGFFDYEGSGSAQTDYIENIVNYMNTQAGSTTTKAANIFGVRDDDTGEYIVKPKVRYYAPSVGEKFFDYLAKLEKVLPDKVKVKGEWCFIYDATNDNKNKFKGKYDREYLKSHKKLKIPSPDGDIQAIIVVDSYPAMNPRRSDEKDEGDKSMANQARMFADGLKRVKSDMQKKKIIVVGINQLREQPGVMFGSPEREPCGNALKFFSDVRVKTSSVSLSTAGVKGKGAIQEEESVKTEGYDSYRYIKMFTQKNKMGGRPFSSVVHRLVVENADGDATGFCKTWDTYNYLKMTGQVVRRGDSLTFAEGFSYKKKTVSGDSIEEIVFNTPLAGKKLTWLEFKTLIEGERHDIKEILKNLGVDKIINVRGGYKKQLTSKGLDYFKAQTKSITNKKNAKDDGDNDD